MFQPTQYCCCCPNTCIASQKASKRQLIVKEFLHHSSTYVVKHIAISCKIYSAVTTQQPNPSQRPCLEPQAATVFHFGFSQTDQPEALAAVTVPVPSVRKQGFNFAIVSKLLPCRGCSSVLTSIGPAKQSVILAGGSNHTDTS